MSKRLLKELSIVLTGLVVLGLSCTSVYYNTFFNAEQAFNSAEKKRKSSARGSIDKRNYQIAIEKAEKVIEKFPDSKYYDDALYLLGVSYYFTDQPSKAERRFRELLANYEDSKYAQDATVYLARAKLALGNEDAAMEVFIEIFDKDFTQENKTDAALALGQYYFENDNFEDAERYYGPVRDSLGDDAQVKLAQKKIAQGRFQAFHFGEALSAYLQILGMDPTTDDRYLVLHQAAMCSFRLQRIEAGMEYLQQLMDDELYFDSLDILKFRMAQGYELDEDLDLASDLYREVALGEGSRRLTSQANYQLGLIYQFDYDDLTVAKAFYDLTIKTDKSSEIGKDALQRSTDIGKLQLYNKEYVFDSTANQQAFDDAAYNQFLLAELYWFALNKPDSAINEMQFLVDSFPDTYDAPNAMIALSQMYNSHHNDSAVADSILEQVLVRYPQSDFVPLAIQALGLKGTAVDTGYAEYFLHRAEDFLVDEDNVDSARANYQIIIDRFPDSKYFVQANFNLILLTELYDHPGDSSVYFAYLDFIDSFPGTSQSAEAVARTTTKGPSIRPNLNEAGIDSEGDQFKDELGNDAADDLEPSGSYQLTEEILYRRPNGDTLVLLDLVPIETIEPFVFPEEAYSLETNFIQLFFQILLDFSGRVIELELKNPSDEYPEINIRSERTVKSMTFKSVDVSTLVSTMDLRESPDSRGYWFVFKYIIKKPKSF